MRQEHDLGQLRWRCRRGLRELDVLLIRFLDHDFAAAGDSERRAFECLLSRPDPEILDLLTGRARAEDVALRHVIRRLLRTDRTAPA